MNPLLEMPTAWINDFVVISARIGGIVAFAPMFGAANLPVRLKVLLAMSLSWVITGFLHPMSFEPDTESAGLIMQLAAEVTIGAVIGFTASIIFEIVIFGGYLIDYFIGFGFINIVDPQSGSSISIFSFFYSYLALIVFLLFDAHHIVLEVMVRSYELIPIFGAELHREALSRLLDFTAGIFYIGFQIAAPMFLVMFTIDFSLGMISKTVPQLQVLVVGFPLKISIGLLAVALVLRPTFEFFMELLGSYRETLLWLIKYYGAG